MNLGPPPNLCMLLHSKQEMTNWLCFILTLVLTEFLMTLHCLQIINLASLGIFSLCLLFKAIRFFTALFFNLLDCIPEPLMIEISSPCTLAECFFRSPLCFLCDLRLLIESPFRIMLAIYRMLFRLLLCHH